MTDEEYRYAERVLYQHKDSVRKCAEMASEIAEMRSKGDIQGQSYNSCAGVQGGKAVFQTQ